MQSTYSNYDSDSFIYGSKNKTGGLNPNQEFRPQPQQVGTGAGLLISIKSDVIGKVFIDFTNIIEEPYAFIETFDLIEKEKKDGVITKILLVSVKAKNFRIRFRNGSSIKQNVLKLFTFILPSSPVVSINPDTLPFKVDLSGLLIAAIRDSSGNPIYSTDKRMNTYAALTDSTGTHLSVRENTLTTNAFLNDGSGNKIYSANNRINAYAALTDSSGTHLSVRENTLTTNAFLNDGSGNKIYSADNRINAYAALTDSSGTHLSVRENTLTTNAFLNDGSGNKIYSADNRINAYAALTDSSGTHLSVRENTLTTNAFLNDGSGNKIYSADNRINAYAALTDSSGTHLSVRENTLTTNAFLNDGSGNKIDSIITNTDNTVRSLYVHNVYDYSYNQITFTTDSTNIYSTVLQLNKYKNFDVMFESISATNYAPVRLYVYVSKDNNTFMKSDYYIDIYYGDTSRILTNVTVNGDYIKLLGKKITGLTITTCYIVRKG